MKRTLYAWSIAIVTGISLTVLCFCLRLSHGFAGNSAALQADANAHASARSVNAGLASEKSRSGPAGRVRLAEGYGRLPLSFELNKGQTDSRVKFLSRGRGYTLFLTGNEAVLSLNKSGARSQEPGIRSRFSNAMGSGPQAKDSLLSSLFAAPDSLFVTDGQRSADPSGDRSAAFSRSFDGSAAPFIDALPGPQITALRLRLAGANPAAKVTGLDELPGKSNYFIGNDPKKWRTNVPTYAKVRYSDVYPGIDLVYYGNQGGRLEYDFVVAPGADSNQIKLAVAASYARRSNLGDRRSPLQIDANGDLVIPADGGEVRFHKPIVYQPVGTGLALPSDARRAQEGLPKGAASSAPTAQDRRPVDGRFVLLADNRVGFEVASYDHTRPLIIDPVLVYSTYLGGSNFDYATGIALDSGGNAYVTGPTVSTDFPLANPIQSTNFACCGGGTSFVAKLNPTGSALIYSTYLGGPGESGSGAGIAVDSSGNAYVTGDTRSTAFPTTAGAFQTVFGGGGGGADAYVAKLGSSGSTLVYSTYLGGSAHDAGQAIALDPAGNAYVTGTTQSGNFPTTLGAFQRNLPNGGGVFVTKLNAAGSALVYSTYLAGSNGCSVEDNGLGITVDGSGNAYITGRTGDSNFPHDDGRVPNRVHGQF